MKKILSLTLALAMLFSLTAVMAIPTAAVDGDWHAIPGAKELMPEYEGDPSSLPGWEYTDDGFHTIPTDAWKESTPFMTVQNKNKVDLKEGVYFEVRIDDFTYASDKWFNMHIWDSIGVDPGNGDPAIGSGVQTLVRPSDGSEETPGKVSSIEWFSHTFTGQGGAQAVPEQNKTTEDGKPILAMTLTWDGSSYHLDINGGKADEATIAYMNEKWGGNDSEAYIGITIQNANKGGKAELTILKFGTDKDSATTPMGDDSEVPTNELVPFAEIASPDTVKENEPAIFMNADTTNSDSKTKPAASSGGYSTVNDDFSIHVIAESPNMVAANYKVKNEVSYDIKDFPVAITLTKNFCTCGNADGTCDAFETAYYYVLAGDVLAVNPIYRTAVLSMSYNSYDINGDTYLYFYSNITDEFDLEGRINGLRFDVSGLDLNTEGGNTFDVMFTAFFRTTEEAEAYVENYVKELGWVETEEPTTEETEEPTTEETTEPIVDETDATTAEKDNVTTEAPNGGDETEKTEEGGCASVIGFSAIATVVAVSAAGVVTFRKKRD